VQWRRWVWFNVSMDTPPNKVIRVVEDAIQQTDIANVAKKPLSNCVLMDMNEKGYMRYAMRYWLIDLAPDDPTDAAVRWHILTALQRAGIKLALDERSIHITKENEKYEEMLHHREILLRIKTLKQVDLFSQMTEEELAALAERLRFSPFAKGEIISREGATAHWLYIVIRGEAEVYLEMQDGGKRVLRDLGKGSFFGEMGLMTGAPRSASVVAKTDMECYRLDKEMFEEILHRRPGIAEEISQVLAVRKAEQNSLIQGMSAESASRDATQHSGEILATIKRFFGL
jgi:CRP-like cAMP-binding protein